MAKVLIPTPLRQYAGKQDSVELAGATVGEVLQSLTSQDMYLAGAFILLLCVLTLIGTLISDLLLAVVDPRIRYD